MKTHQIQMTYLYLFFQLKIKQVAQQLDTNFRVQGLISLFICYLQSIHCCCCCCFVVIFVNMTLFSTMNSTNDNKGLKSAFHFFARINLAFCCCCCCLIHCHIQFDVLLSFVEFIVENNVIFTKMTTKQQQQWILYHQPKSNH